ncbi:hypothetical protein BGZ95_000216 [Linnemannia exigua]|uniref:Inhibitor I9 domain-containing protein n=1 Tax=Linnemannia exigua TaxID=604196 RepID=A0AAD4H4Y0_9FUNG|nr:hypothetical protein BGZ95_000216 [Linnemannia exigua]
MTSDQEAANAFSASVLPVATQNPGDKTAKSLAQHPGQAPQKGGAQAQVASNKVIVVFKTGTAQEEITKAENDIIAQGGTITQRYTSALLGFAAALPDNSIQALSVHPQVNYIEPDGEVSAYAKSLIA